MPTSNATQVDEGQRPLVDDAASLREIPTVLRLVTWNLNHWRQPMLPTDTRRAAWEYLSRGIGAGVALVQEAVPPLELEGDRAVYGEIAGHRNWGSAVAALDPRVSIEPLRAVRVPWTRRRFLLANTHPGSVAIARLLVPGIQPITLLSVYGVLDGSPVSTMHRVIADLVPLFDSPHGARVILGGDLNVSSSTKDPRQVARAEAVFAAIRSLGLIEAKAHVAQQPASPPDCPCGNGGTCSHLGTWSNVELDHLYVSPSLAGQLTALSVDTAAVEAGLSDHAPLVLDLALSAERTPQTWDEESFAEEIGRRHGPAARDVVEKLVNWAELKERELAATTGVCAKSLTRFPTNGCTAEPELMFPVDLNLEPRGSQPTISIHADGTVVVWLGAMGHPPFDTESARHELRRAINELDGVYLPSRQVNGWPRFPISALEDTANLVRLAAVMDRIATESHTVRDIEIAPVELAGDRATRIAPDVSTTTGV
jgi:endonuclease/exonuclease/phosphatase family metal-dependent hydrolase